MELRGAADPTSHNVGELAWFLAGNRRVLACHVPYRGDSHDHDRFVERRPVDQGAWLLHGHVHERWRQRGRMINVGVDVCACGPVDEATLAAFVEDGPNSLAPVQPRQIKSWP